MHNKLTPVEHALCTVTSAFVAIMILGDYQITNLTIVLFIITCVAMQVTIAIVLKTIILYIKNGGSFGGGGWM